MEHVQRSTRDREMDFPRQACRILCTRASKSHLSIGRMECWIGLSHIMPRMPSPLRSCIRLMILFLDTTYTYEDATLPPSQMGHAWHR